MISPNGTADEDKDGSNAQYIQPLKPSKQPYNKIMIVRWEEEEKIQTWRDGCERVDKN